MRDYTLLYGKIRSRRLTQKEVAKAVGIGETSLNLALNNKREFKQDEIMRMCDLLEIPADLIGKYFFAQ